MFKIKDKTVEIGIFVLSLALLFVVISGASLNKKIVQQMDAREAQASSLISEIGTLREENLKMSQKIKNNDVNFEALARMVSEFRKTEQGLKIKNDHAKPADKALPVAIVESSDDAVDILLAGLHQKLTDTIILARINENLEKVTFVSIPRDLSVAGRKINEYYGLYGINELVKQVDKVTGAKIDHYAVVDMSAFKKIVDAVDGVDINVEKDISDYLYPRNNDSYETYSIAKGQHHFDGEQALRFARSRSSSSDFDRADRQQKILAALKDRVLSLEFLKNLNKAQDFYQSVFSLVETDVGFLEALQYLQKYGFYALKTGDVISTANYLYPSRNLQGQYILLPKGGDFGEVREYVRGM